MSPSRLLSDLLALCLLTSAASAQQKARALGLADFYALKRVSDPQVSPDGKLVCYSVGTVDLDGNRVVNHLWLAPVAGGEPKQLTNHPKGEREGRWSSDGRWIAFVSARDGSPQIWKIAADGGEAIRVTSISTGAGGPVWSPAADQIAFVSDVWPDLKTDAEQKARADQQEKSGIEAKVADDLLYRHWNEWRDGKRTHTFVVSAAGGEAKDVTPGDWDSPPFSLGGPDAYAFSADGKKLAYTRGPEKSVEAISTNADLFLVDLATGERRNLTADNKGWDGSPMWMPESELIAYRSQERDGYESDRFRLRLVNASTGQTRTVAETLDRNIDEFLFLESGILAGVEEDGSHAAYSVSLQGPEPKVRLRGANVASFTASVDGKVLVGLRASLVRPAEVVRIDGDQIVPVTHVNDALVGELALPSSESIRWKGGLDAEVQGWLLKPPGFEAGRKYPFLLWIHGGPQGAWLDAWSNRWNPALYAAQGYVVLLPNPHGSTGFGQRFTEQISGDWGGACFVDLMKGVDHVVAQGIADEQRMGAAGGSFGGYMVNWILGHSTRFKALVSHAGVYNLESMYGVTEELWFPEWDLRGTSWKNGGNYQEFSPHRYAANFKTPTLVIHGELDYRVPIGEGLQLFTALRRQGIEAKLLYFPDEGHWVNKPKNSRLWNQTVSTWFEKHLKRAAGER